MNDNYIKQYVNACISYNIDKVSDNHNQIECLLKSMPFIMDRYLTEREKDIFIKIANGTTQTDMAEYYGISQPTVSRTYNHCIEVIRDKLIIVIEAIKQYDRILQEVEK